ncbi:MAG: hypothetical protein GOVbin1807_208 [Prokaryotic dsDNA virus sp.]|nr:MAG: hypothetical protein GOVbin1807_208 [Prokaryotic dsDNA virus sp.]|tara:strand:- start:5961 stop:6185 length:225 start_codon:yes stop_codon:yes gene_type:complete
MTIISTKQLSNGLGQTVITTLVVHNGNYFVVSENPRETLIFPSNSKGEHKFLEVGSGFDTADCLNQIENGQIMS